MVGVNGRRFPAIRRHFEENIAKVYKDMDVRSVSSLLWIWETLKDYLGTAASFTNYPEEGETNTEAYEKAIDALSPGDAVIIFTPDSTHAPIAEYALSRKLHVQITKPATQKLVDHQRLVDLAEKNGVLCTVEHHKRRCEVSLESDLLTGTDSRSRYRI